MVIAAISVRETACGRTASAIVECPLGILTIEATERGVTAVQLRDAASSSDACDAGRAPSSAASVARRAADEIRAYLADPRIVFSVPLAARGTDFQQRVWDALRAIPCGETMSYGELARRIGSPNASRAVGMACGRNPIPILVPCHRVVAADGSLHGFSSGLWRKKWLLEHERGAGLFSRGVRSTP